MTDETIEIFEYDDGSGMVIVTTSDEILRNISETIEGLSDTEVVTFEVTRRIVTEAEYDELIRERAEDED